MSMNTYGNVAGNNQLTAENAEFYQRTLLDRLKNGLAITKYAEKSMGAPKNSGDKISFRRFGNLAVSKTELVEGVTPDAITASVSKVESTVKQYGAYLVVTDKLQMVGLDPVITELAEVLGDQASESIEAITVDVLTSGTNVSYAGAKTDRATLTSTDVLTTDMLLRLATQFKDNKCKQITLPDGSKGYILFVHPRQAYDLKKDPKFVEVQTHHKDSSNIINGLVGKMHGIFVVEYDMSPVLEGAGAAGADVYQAIALSQGAFGMPDIEGSAKPEMIIKTAKNDDGNTADPLSQRSTIAWKNLFDVVILDQVRLVRLETSSTY